MTTDATVDQVVKATDYDHFVADPDGTMLAQSSSIASISKMLTWLDVRPGQRVLELGTGSGYTTALLSQLVGPHGAVRSVEVFADLVPRATARLTEAGIENATVTHGDGYVGYPEAAPYDRIVAWATPHLIPRAWIEQTAGEAVIVAPVKVAELAFANAICAMTVHDHHAARLDVHPGGYIEMHPEPITDFALPRRCVDASYAPDGAEPWWISSPLLRDDSVSAERLLTSLRIESTASASILDAAESLSDLTAWLLATRPGQVAIAGLSNRFMAYGTVTTSGAALLTDDELVVVGDSAARDRLAEWVVEWHQDGRPGWDDLAAEAIDSPDGWRTQLHL